MKLYIANAPTLSILDRLAQVLVRGEWDIPRDDLFGTVARIPRPVDNPEQLVAAWEDAGAEIISVIGDADMARVLSGILGRELPANRVSVRLGLDEMVLVGQLTLTGPRPPEGATELPEGATIEWWIV